MTYLNSFFFTGGKFPRRNGQSTLEVSTFELQWHYYVHFWTNAFVKAMNPLILPAIG